MSWKALTGMDFNDGDPAEARTPPSRQQEPAVWAPPAENTSFPEENTDAEDGDWRGEGRLRVKRSAVHLLLARRNETQNWLARKVGVTQTHLSRVMHGRCPAPPILRGRMMRALGVKDWRELFEPADEG
jgi:hypothetical protein